MSPTPRRVSLLLALALLASGLLAVFPAPPAAGQPAAARTVQFCFWNVENLFDDRPDAGREGVDRAFDAWYARNRDVLDNKLERVCRVLLGKRMNAGRGPDVLALAEVESKRAAELVKNALNARLRDRALHYKSVVFIDPRGGRSIGTAAVSRVPIDEKKTRLLGKAQRILKVHVTSGNHELAVLVTHWTSRVSDRAGRGRSAYGEIVHRDFAASYRRNPEVDYLVCGDFNDNPNDPAVVESLGASTDLKKVLGLGRKDRPLLYNPFGDLARAKKGTHYHAGTPHVFDQICVSPGLLDGVGWSYVGRSARVVEELQFRGRPDRFGGPDDKRPWRNRGASDHYPVTAELRVQPSK